MNMKSRRNFIASCITVGTALALGTLPKKTFAKLKTNNDNKKWIRERRWDKVTHVTLDDGTKYEVKVVDTNEDTVSFTGIHKDKIETDFWCPIYGKDLECLETFDKNLSKESIHKYLVVNSKGDLGFLGSDSICWDFRPFEKTCGNIYAKVENLRKIRNI